MVKLDDSPWKNGPPKELTDEEEAAIHRGVARAFAISKLTDAALLLRELGYDVSADAVETIAREMRRA